MSRHQSEAPGERGSSQTVQPGGGIPGQEEGEAPEEEGQDDTEAGPEPAPAVASDAELILQPLVDNGTENIVAF